MRPQPYVTRTYASSTGWMLGAALALSVGVIVLAVLSTPTPVTTLPATPTAGTPGTYSKASKSPEQMEKVPATGAIGKVPAVERPDVAPAVMTQPGSTQSSGPKETGPHGQTDVTKPMPKAAPEAVRIEQDRPVGSAKGG